jgi:hypothetical protein
MPDTMVPQAPIILGAKDALLLVAAGWRACSYAGDVGREQVDAVAVEVAARARANLRAATHATAVD